MRSTSNLPRYDCKEKRREEKRKEREEEMKESEYERRGTEKKRKRKEVKKRRKKRTKEEIPRNKKPQLIILLSVLPLSSLSPAPLHHPSLGGDNGEGDQGVS